MADKRVGYCKGQWDKGERAMRMENAGLLPFKCSSAEESLTSLDTLQSEL